MTLRPGHCKGLGPGAQALDVRVPEQVQRASRLLASWAAEQRVEQALLLPVWQHSAVLQNRAGHARPPSGTH